MRYYRIYADNGYCGCSKEWYTFSEKEFTEEDEIEIKEMAISEMSGYEYVCHADDAETEEEYDEIITDYYEGIGWDYEEITEKEYQEAFMDGEDCFRW